MFIGFCDITLHDMYNVSKKACKSIVKASFYENNNNFNDVCINVCLFVCLYKHRICICTAFKSYCLPFILITTEAISLTTSSIKMLDDCIK